MRPYARHYTSRLNKYSIVCCTTWGQAYDARSGDDAILTGLVEQSGEFMEDEQSERKKPPAWTGPVAAGLTALAAAFLAQCILNWDAILGQGFKALQWDSVLPGAVGGFVLIWVMPVGQRREITTLGIGQFTAKKLR
jgi:hypothetical protein